MAARAAAEFGYEGVWANDVLVHSAGPSASDRTQQLIEPLVTLASLVHLVPSLTLGTAVVVLPVRDPILVAKQAAALHVLSGGRCVLGVGIGHRASEFEILGADFTERAAVTEGRVDPSIANMLYVRMERPDEPKTVRSTTPRMPASPFTGSADAVAEHIGRYAGAGLDHALIVFDPESVDDLLRQMHTFAEQVAPRFAASG